MTHKYDMRQPVRYGFRAAEVIGRSYCAPPVYELRMLGGETVNNVAEDEIRPLSEDNNEQT